MKVYVLKWAFTKGILLIEAEHCGSGSDNMVKFNTYTYLHKGQWTESLEEAKEIYEKMKASKIKSLEKQLAKLNKREFKVKVKDMDAGWREEPPYE